MAATIRLVIEGEGVQVEVPNARDVPPRHESSQMKLGYKVHEAAEIAGISESNLRVHIQNGDLKARKNGYHYLILHDELDAFLHERPVFVPGEAA